MIEKEAEKINSAVLKYNVDVGV